jgi:hypothetical protein
MVLARTCILSKLVCAVCRDTQRLPDPIQRALLN